LNVSELIWGMMHSRTFKKQCMYRKDIFLKTPLLIYWNFLPKMFFQNVSFQTQGVAYLQVWLIWWCLWYLFQINLCSLMFSLLSLRNILTLLQSPLANCNLTLNKICIIGNVRAGHESSSLFSLITVGSQ